MNVDPFEVRMQFLENLRRLTASQQSIQKVVHFALKFYPSCGDDLWDCLVEECQKGTVNSRINIFYLLDSLCETCLSIKANSSSNDKSGGPHGSYYVELVSKDLAKLVEYVVPEGREGLPNLSAARQILENWRNKRIIDPQRVDGVITALEQRKATTAGPDQDNVPRTRVSESSSSTLTRPEVFKRIEEDRERHKRLRERRWVQPVYHNPNPHILSPLASFMPYTDQKDGEAELTIDIEFENEWETTSDWNEDDDEAATEENQLCFPTNGHRA